MTVTRRRFLTLSAVAALVPSLPGQGQAGVPVHVWKGIALGAQATIRLAHRDGPAIAARAAAEIDRLEQVFSLHRPGSALSQLNATGRLEAPPFELLECLALAGRVHQASGGLFDPTVQPLWALHAEAAVRGQRPGPAALADRLARCGWARVRFDAAAVVLDPGMAITLNGIAQGLIADRVTRLLADEGLTGILVETGELRALGGAPDGAGWPVRLPDDRRLGLQDRALATSAPLGTVLDAAGQVGHILDPRTGQPAAAVWRSISVSAPSAGLADALSTAACLTADAGALAALIAAFPEAVLESAVPV
jgi:FAD:protein FMN transferase